MLCLVSRTKDKNQAVLGYFDIVENTEPSLITDSHEVRYEFKSAQIKIVKGNQKIKVPISEDLLKLLYLTEEVENPNVIKHYKDLWDFAMNAIVKNVFRDLKVNRELQEQLYFNKKFRNYLLNSEIEKKTKTFNTVRKISKFFTGFGLPLLPLGLKDIGNGNYQFGIVDLLHDIGIENHHVIYFDEDKVLAETKNGGIISVPYTEVLDELLFNE